MGKNRSHGKIDRLPDTLRKAVEAKLLEGYTYEEISEYLKKMGHDVHLSSVARYGRPFLAKFESVRMAKEFAQSLAEDNPDRPTTELHEANNALISQMIMEALVSEDGSPEETAKLAKSIATLQRAQVSNEKLKIESRKAAGEARQALKLLKEQVFREIGEEHPDIANAILQIADAVESKMEADGRK